MRIAVIGAGVMGCIYGGPLSVNNEMLLVDVYKPHIDAINNDGLRIKELDGSINVYGNPRATDDTSKESPADIVILLCKGYQTASALGSNKRLIGENTVVLSLQNGYGNADEIMKFVPQEQIVLGTSSHGGIMEGPGKVFHSGTGVTQLGCLTESQRSAEMIASVLESAGIKEVVLVPNVKRLVWHKLFVNCAINPIGALPNDTNQTVLNNEFSNAAARKIVAEAVEVANAAGMDFDFNEEFEYVLTVSKETANVRCSMLADVTNKRKTEVDRINGAIVSEAAKLGMRAPLNELMTELIHAKELTY